MFRCRNAEEPTTPTMIEFRTVIKGTAPSVTAEFLPARGTDRQGPWSSPNCRKDPLDQEQVYHSRVRRV